MTGISAKKCFNHVAREAAARCPDCGRFFCRECVTEHDGRVVCAACLKKLLSAGKKIRPSFAGVILFANGLVAFILLWILIYYVGQLLLMLPSSFHEGNLWQKLPWNMD
jgi:hypothetical protein